LRRDLFYRISSVRIFLPPLRDRLEDIKLLASAFLKDCCTKHSKAVHWIEPGVISILKSHDWPGNVRELKSAIEFAVCVADSNILRAEHLPDHIKCKMPEHREAKSSGVVVALDEAEKRIIKQVLEDNGGSRTLAAEAMGLSRTTFYRKCKKYGLVEHPKGIRQKAL